MLVNIDRITNRVAGVNAPANPLFINIEVPENFTLSKTIKVQDGQVQKTNDKGELLYLNKVTRMNTVRTLVRQEETTEDTGTPIIERVQKTNDLGEPLYYKYVDNEVIETVDSIEIIKVPLQPAMDGDIQKTYVQVDDNGEIQEVPVFLKQVGFEFVETTETELTIENQLQPVMINVQKTDTDNNPLYLKDIFGSKEEIEETFEEVNYPRLILEYEDKEVPNMVLVEEEVDEIQDDGTAIKVKTGQYIEVQDGTKVIQVEKSGQDLEPVMVDNFVDKTISLQDQPEEFKMEEVLYAKYNKILDASNCDYIVADMFLDENDLDLSNIQANTGYGILELLANDGYAKTKPIQLETNSKVFYLLEFDAKDTDILINDVKVEDSKCILDNFVDEITIEFVNKSSKRQMVRSYAIGY